MSNSGPHKTIDENATKQRLNTFNDALLAVPGYADDTMFFAVRYVTSAREHLREQDFDDFMQIIGQLNDLSVKGNKGEATEDIAENVRELKNKAAGKIIDFPNLLDDFDKFLSCSRATMRALSSPQV